MGFCPSLNDMHSALDVTAYHEAGHARAAAKRGATVNQIEITTDDVHGNYLGSTYVDIDPAHEAFYAYAGPWVSARLLEGPEKTVDIDRVARYMRESEADWPIFQKAMGRTDVTSDASLQAYMIAMTGGGPPPGEILPDSKLAKRWHRDLDDEWPQIEYLARNLLEGTEEITVGNGVLFQINRTCWRRPGWLLDKS